MLAPLGPHNAEIIVVNTAVIVANQMGAGVQTGTNAVMTMTDHAKATASLTTYREKSAQTPAFYKGTDISEVRPLFLSTHLFPNSEASV